MYSFFCDFYQRMGRRVDVGNGDDKCEALWYGCSFSPFFPWKNWNQLGFAQFRRNHSAQRRCFGSTQFRASAAPALLSQFCSLVPPCFRGALLLSTFGYHCSGFSSLFFAAPCSGSSSILLESAVFFFLTATCTAPPSFPVFHSQMRRPKLCESATHCFKAESERNIITKIPSTLE